MWLCLEEEREEVAWEEVAASWVEEEALGVVVAPYQACPAALRGLQCTVRGRALLMSLLFVCSGLKVQLLFRAATNEYFNDRSAIGQTPCQLPAEGKKG